MTRGTIFITLRLGRSGSRVARRSPMADFDHQQLNGELRDAVQENNALSVERCLEQGADINSHGGVKGQTALHIAAFSGNDSMIQLLVGKGADINAIAEAEDSGGTALHWAAFAGHATSCKLLLELGVDAAVVNQHGRTAKMIAERNGNAGVAALLP